LNLRELFLEKLAGDLEYHPRRALIYLTLAVGAACFWIFSPADNKFTPVPLVFALGSLTLLAKGVFLLRPSSEGVGLSDAEVSELAGGARRKKLPSISEQAAQVVQDFGAGGLLLWPLLNLGENIDQTWNRPPRLPVFAGGVLFFGVGWLIRRFIRRETQPS
jgi:hypothetical protein